MGDDAGRDGSDDAGRDGSADALRKDLNTEYYAILEVVTGFDQRLMTIKGWSVTLSLTGLGLAFQQQHYALFALAAGTAAAFWIVDAMTKRHQRRYYARMRDIEVAAYHLNHQRIGTVVVSAPRIDWAWHFTGARGTEDPRGRTPVLHTAQEIRTMLWLTWVLPHVALPHALAVVVGLVLWFAALQGWWGLPQTA